MIENKNILIAVLVIPIVCLAFMMANKQLNIPMGTEVTLPITGYDPRDLLSGHYLIYTIDYGVEDICKNSSSKLKMPGYICLSTKKFSQGWPKNCELIIKGTCDRSRFVAGIERYYIPDKEAKKAEDLVISNEASIVLSVKKNGEAQIKDLLIDGISLKNLYSK